MTVHNGNNVKDWTIRSTPPKSVMIGYGGAETIAKILVLNETLIKLRGLKVRSSFI